MADVYELFNQTVNAGATSRESEEDDSSSDDDSESDDGEGVTESQVPPTPLPAPVMNGMMRMGLSTPGPMVPPTPTPAQGHLSGRKLATGPLQVFAEESSQPPPSASKMAVFRDENAPPTVFADENAAPQRLPVFQDENAVPRSAKKPLGSGLATPAKTPLAPKSTPLGVKSIDASGATPMRPSADVSQYTTPRSEGPQRRMKVFDDEEQSTGNSQQGHLQEQVFSNFPEAIQEEEEPEEGYDGYNARRVFSCGAAFNTMTPITERTEQYTQSTQGFTLRSSTSSALGKALESDDEEDPLIDVQPPVVQRLETVAEDSERTARTEEPSCTISQPQSPHTDSRSQSARFSSEHTGQSLFQLSPGHTIANEVNPTITNSEVVDVVAPAQPSVRASSRRLMPASPKILASATPGSDIGSSFAPPNPCCPTDTDIINQLVAALETPLSEMRGFNDLRGRVSGQLGELQKTFKSALRRSSSNKRTSTADVSYLLQISNKQYEVQDKIGEGGFGAVFRAIDLEARDIADEASDDEEDEMAAEAAYTVAVKVEQPANMWEAVILSRVRERLQEEHHPSIVNARGLHLFADESMLVLDFYSQGTLLNAVNNAASWGIGATSSPGMDEILAIFFAIELMKAVEALHRADFLHGDLKIDNCLIRLSESHSGWKSQYEMTGAHGWSEKGIRLIDFGRAIDFQMWPARTEQTFIADWKTDEKDCVEMREGQPWSYQADYHGLASICYCMLFGKYMTVEVAPPLPEDGDRKRYRAQGAFKRVSDAEKALVDGKLMPLSSTGKPSSGTHCSTCF